MTELDKEILVKDILKIFESDPRHLELRRKLISDRRMVNPIGVTDSASREFLTKYLRKALKNILTLNLMFDDLMPPIRPLSITVGEGCQIICQRRSLWIVDKIGNDIVCINFTFQFKVLQIVRFNEYGIKIDLVGFLND